MQGLILAVLFSVSANAKTVIVNAPAADPDLDAIETAMKAAGHPVLETQCSGGKCAVRLDDASSANAATLAPFFSVQTRAQKRQALVDELDAIEAKLDDGTATAADVRRAVKLMLKLSGLARRP